MGILSFFKRREQVPTFDTEDFIRRQEAAYEYHRRTMERILDEDEVKWSGGGRVAANRFEINSSNLQSSLTNWRNTAEFPSVKRARKLYRQLVFSPGFTLGLKRIKGEAGDTDHELNEAVALEWKHTMKANVSSFSEPETVDRAMRDGDCFIWYGGRRGEFLKVVFVDSEEIYDKNRKDGTDNKGIVTEPDDVTTVKYYTRFSDPNQEEPEIIPAEEMVHIKIDVDSNEKRGRSRFDGLLRRVAQLEEFLDTEYTHRRAQASIVLQRKVTGGGNNARMVLDNAYAGRDDGAGTVAVNLEKLRPGMFVTSNQNVDLEFLQPESHFADATGIARMLTRVVCQTTGFTYEQISSDVSEGNLASAEIGETPVKDMIESERQFFVTRMLPLFDTVVATGLAAGRIPQFSPDEFEVVPVFAPPQSKDFVKLTQALNAAQMAKAISRAEFARSINRDPQKMEMEIAREYEKEYLLPDANNPTLAAKADSMKANASAGGTNQGTTPASHSDNKGSGKE